MPRIACLAVVPALSASLACGEAVAAQRHEHRLSSTSHHPRSQPAQRPSLTVRTPVAAPVVNRVVTVIPAPASYSARQPLTFSRSATPPVYYVGAISPNAPPFSFAPSEPQAGWGWQRVSYQQLDAEVRARRAAKAHENPQGHRLYCPDTRAYYPRVSRCDSEWLTVVASPTLR